MAVGSMAVATGEDAIAVGGTATGFGTLALGAASKAHQDVDVAVGAAAETSATVAATGNTIAGKAYTFAGANPAAAFSVGNAGLVRQIQNVAAGQINANSTDAINGSQLYAAYNAIDVTNAAGLNFSGNSGATVHRNLGETLGIVGAKGSTAGVTGLAFDATTAATAGAYSAKNIQTVTDALGNVQIQMAERPVFDKVTANTVAGTTVTAGAPGSNTVTLDGNGLTISNPANSTGNVVIADGNVNFGGNTLSNIGDAVNQGDAVNLKQLQAAANAATLHYLSVNDNNIQSGNYDNKGASGANAIALGVNAGAVNVNGVAVGNKANAYGDNAIAIGAESTALTQSSALG